MDVYWSAIHGDLIVDFEKERKSLEDGLHFDGFSAITDPLRKDVCNAVDKCRKAGIDVKMLTGNNIITASAIAKELQLLEFNSRELSDTSIFCNLASNRLMLGVFALTFALQVIITQIGGAFFGTVPLDFLMWCKIIVVAFSVILVSEIAKLMKRVLMRNR